MRSNYFVSFYPFSIVEPLTTEHLYFVSLATSDTSKKSLEEIFSADNSNVPHYGNGDHGTPERILKKIDLWGKRAENDEPMRCFLVYEKDSENAAGFVNIGFSNIKMNGTKLLEGGALFQNSYNESPLVAEALGAVLNDYGALLMVDRTAQAVPEPLAPGLVYTISATNPMFDSMKEIGLSRIEFTEENTNNFQQHCMLSLIRDTPGFQVDNNIIYEGIRPVEVFYQLYDTTACPPLPGWTVLDLDAPVSVDEL